MTDVQKRLTPVELDQGAVEVLNATILAIEAQILDLAEEAAGYKDMGDQDQEWHTRAVSIGMFKAKRTIQQFIKQGWMPIELAPPPTLPVDANGVMHGDGRTLMADGPSEEEQAPYAPGFELLKSAKAD